MTRVCKRGHTPIARYKNGDCILCVKLRNAAWWEKNPHKMRELKKAWKERNKEKEATRQREANKKAYWENPEHTREISRKSKRKRVAIRNAESALRRSQKLKAIPCWADKDAIKVIYREARKSGYHVDHIIPLKGKTVCGLHVETNLQLLPPFENLSKGNRI